MPKFQVYKDAAGKCRFRLRADNNEIVVSGEGYEKYFSCKNGIKSIQKNCNAPVEDITVEGQRISNPKFQIYKDKAEKYRFNLFARNGEIIASSEGYDTKESCLNGIKVVGQSCDAEVEDLTQREDASLEKKVIIANSEVINAPQDIAKTDDDPITTAKKDEMLVELKKIREAVEKGPPPTPPKGLWNEFKDFLSKYQVLGLAVAFVLGLYLGTVVQSLVTGFIMPIIGLALPGLGNLADASFEINNQKFLYGNFIAALITFIIVAFIAFIIVKIAKKWKID